MTYGCHNRKPIQTSGATTCQYTLSEIGKVDKKCEGCKERREPFLVIPEGWFIQQEPSFGWKEWSDCA